MISGQGRVTVVISWKGTASFDWELWLAWPAAYLKIK
jgi:hypothetical protein